MVVTTASDGSPAGAAHAGRAAAGRSPLALRSASGHRRLRAGGAGAAVRRRACRASPPAPRRRRPRRLLAGHRRGPHRLHPVRPLRPRLQRHPPQPGHRPDGQGLRGAASPSTLDEPDGRRPSCVACGECMVSCPTGALTNRKVVRPSTWHGRRASRRAGRADGQLPDCFERCRATFLALQPGRWSAGTSRRARSSAARASSARPRSTSTRARSRSPSPPPLAHLGTGRRGPRAWASSARLTEPGARRRQDADRERGAHALHPDRRRRSTSSYGNPVARWARRPLRRDDLHELLSALGDRARRPRRRDGAGDAAATSSTSSSGASRSGRCSTDVPRAGARQPPAQRPDLLADLAATHVRRPAARHGRAGALRAGRGDLPPGRPGRHASTSSASAS